MSIPTAAAAIEAQNERIARDFARMMDYRHPVMDRIREEIQQWIQKGHRCMEITFDITPFYLSYSLAHHLIHLLNERGYAARITGTTITITIADK